MLRNHTSAKSTRSWHSSAAGATSKSKSEMKRSFRAPCDSTLLREKSEAGDA